MPASADWAANFQIDGLGCQLELRFDAAVEDAVQLEAGKGAAVSASDEVRQLLALAAEAVAATVGVAESEESAARESKARVEADKQLASEQNERVAAEFQLLQLQIALHRSECALLRQRFESGGEKWTADRGELESRSAQATEVCTTSVCVHPYRDGFAMLVLTSFNRRGQHGWRTLPVLLVGSSRTSRCDQQRQHFEASGHANPVCPVRSNTATGKSSSPSTLRGKPGCKK